MSHVSEGTILQLFKPEKEREIGPSALDRVRDHIHGCGECMTIYLRLETEQGAEFQRERELRRNSH